MKKVFISGAISGKGEGKGFLHNIYNMIQTAGKVRDMGFAVYCPCLDILLSLSCGCLEHEQYYKIDLAWLEDCHAMLLVKGWENSKGVKGEIKKANALNIPIFDNLNDLNVYFKNQQI